MKQFNVLSLMVLLSTTITSCMHAMENPLARFAQGAVAVAQPAARAAVLGQDHRRGDPGDGDGAQLDPAQVVAQFNAAVTALQTLMTTNQFQIQTDATPGRLPMGSAHAYPQHVMTALLRMAPNDRDARQRYVLDFRHVERTAEKQKGWLSFSPREAWRTGIIAAAAAGSSAWAMKWWLER